jgi:hypothetical protein
MEIILNPKNKRWSIIAGGVLCDYAKREGATP